MSNAFTQEEKSIVRDSLALTNLNDTITGHERNIPGQLIVTGYSQQERDDITGSVSVIGPEILTSIPAENITGQLQGLLSGVTVTGSGQPGSVSKVRIRGLSSFENNDPLYIVDGVPTQDISFLNSNDVESLCVLKDAGAATIYGSRASNGVIVIKTKSGSKGISIKYNMYLGTQLPGKGTSGDVLDAQEYADLQWLVYANDGNYYDTHPIYGPSSNPEPSFPSWAANTDWYDAITDRAGIMNHDLVISGGSENAKFYTGFGYFRQDGIVIHTNSERYNARLNSEYNLFKGRLRLGEKLNFSFHKNLSVPNLDEKSPVHLGPYRSQSIIPVIVTEPITGIIHNFIPGEWGGTGIEDRLGYTSNPVATLTRDENDKFTDNSLTGSTYADIMIAEGLNFRSVFGGTYNNGLQRDTTIAPYEDAPYGSAPVSSMVRKEFSGGDWVWTNTLTFDKQFGQHKILALAGYEAANYGMGRVITGSDTIDYTPIRLLSAFLKADYGYGEKYYVSATVRRDGCSRFGKENRYGLFPSVGAGWRISNESFFKGIGWINDLKIRGSYGITGNQFAISPYSSYLLFSGNIALSSYDINGTTNSAVVGYYPAQIANPDIKWETTKTIDIGFDSRIWKDRIGIIFDWYQRKSEDLLYRNWNIPGTLGETVPPFVNSGSMKNSGIDMELTFKNRWGDFGINTNFILSAYRNEIIHIANGSEFFDSGETITYASFARNMIGHPMSSFFGYIVEGLFQNQNEVESAPQQQSAQPGFLRFADTHSDSYIDPADRTFIGNPNPDFTYGFNLGITYKNFDLNAFFYGSHGNEILNWNKWYTDFWPSYQGQKSHDLLYDSWTPSNTGAKTPKATYNSNFSTNGEICSYYIEDGSYLRLKNLQIGYSVPGKFLGKTGITSLRFYLQGINLFTLTKYTGLDPELGGPDTCFGVDNGNYPNVRQFIFGLNLII